MLKSQVYLVIAASTSSSSTLVLVIPTTSAEIKIDWPKVFSFKTNWFRSLPTFLYYSPCNLSGCGILVNSDNFHPWNPRPFITTKLRKDGNSNIELPPRLFYSKNKEILDVLVLPPLTVIRTKMEKSLPVSTSASPVAHFTFPPITSVPTASDKKKIQLK